MPQAYNFLLVPSPFIAETLHKKVVFFTGKGGVGKSTLSWATAKACESHGASVIVASWSPFDSAAQPIAKTNTRVRWLPLDALSAFREYAIQRLKFEKVYNMVFENHVLKTFIRAAPGLSETVIAGKIWDLYAKSEADLIVVDLPSTGHAYSFFQSPFGVQKIFAMGFVHREAEKISEMFTSPNCRIDLVSLPEELAITEALELKDKLERLCPFQFGYFHINQTTPTFVVPPHAHLARTCDATRELVSRYQNRIRTEAASIELAGKIRLPQIRTPQFALVDTEALVNQVSESLERGP